HVWIHIFAVAGRVVTHGVSHDRRMILRTPNVELGVTSVAVVRVGIGFLPVVLAEMWLRKGDEHPNVVGGPEDLGKAEVRTRLAPVVVCIHEIDARSLQPRQSLLGPVVTGQRSIHLRVIQRYGTKEYAAGVEIEVTPIDPKLTEAKSLGQADIQHPVVRVTQ